MNCKFIVGSGKNYFPDILIQKYIYFQAGNLMSNIETNIEIWKKSLLDLGKKNRLLNYRDTKRSNIRIISPDIDSLYHRLVVKEKLLSFPSPVESNLNEDSEETENSRQRFMSGDLETDRSISEQQKTLRVLRGRAKTAIEEQGVNILYLSFGFIKWKERQDSDQVINSPLVLVPVILTVESLTSPFVLSLHEDEIVINPTLVYKFENDFGLHLPEFETNEENIDDYLSKVNVLAINNGWTLSYETDLSLLSFLKINMYRDLGKNKERIISHPILRALSGEKKLIKNPPEELTNWDHDKNEKPIDTFEVLNADSSQQDAILYAKKGISFVLQGPPGTGKSQTITNIISTSLADGKKVLFVSEKMAALEVVYKRLTEVGLSDFCLTLHSQKANKKEVLKQLGQTLSLPKFALKNDVFEQLENLRSEREKLDQYDTQLHTQCVPLNKCIYDINGELAKLSEQNIPDIIFPINNIKTIDSENLRLFSNLINELARTLGKMKNDYFGNVWWDCKIQNLTHEIRGNIASNLSVLIPNLQAIYDKYKVIVNELCLNQESSLNKIDQLIDILNVSAKSPRVPSEWIYEDSIMPLVESANKYNDLVAERRLIFEDLENTCDEDFFRVPAQQTHNSIIGLFKKIEPCLNSDTFKDWEEIEQSLKPLIQFLEKLDQNFSTLISINEESHNLLGTQKVRTINDARSFVHFYEYILLNPKAPVEWFENEKFALCKQLYFEVRQLYQEVKSETQSIRSRFDEEILRIDYSSMLKRYKTDYTNIFKIFRKNYYSDKKIIKSLSNEVKKKINDLSIIDILNELKSLHEKESTIKSKENLLVPLLGKGYSYDYTDWNSIDDQISIFEKIKDYFSPSDLSDQVKKGLTSDFSENIGKYQFYYDAIKFILDDSFTKNILKYFNLPEQVDDIDLDHLFPILTDVLINLKNLDKIYSSVKDCIKENISSDVLLNNLDKLERLQEIEGSIVENNDILTRSFHFLFTGKDTDWNMIIQALVWTKEFRDRKAKFSLSDQFIKNICENLNTIQYTKNEYDELIGLHSEIQKELRWFIDLFDNQYLLLNMDIGQLIQRITHCKEDLLSLEQWIDYTSCREKCREVGLSEFVSIVESNKIPPNLLLPIFKKRFYRLWLDAVISDFPAVNTFRRASHEDVVKNFNNLDINQLKIAQTRVKERLVSRLPDTNRLTAAHDEESILRRELTKQRKIMPLRKLFKQIPNLLLTLKPCFMMSPLSVSLFLEDNFYDFDIVIFDEASQVYPEDAIGSILRGKQVVIAGDSKQLPPTSFFSTSISEDDYDVDDDETDNFGDSDAYESILDEAQTVLPQRTLRWHYRSKDESLITFSNSKIYNNSLFTFPSSIQKEDDLGVEYIFVPNGVYDRSGQRNNSIEAQKVADIVFEQIEKHPNRSIGVITFSEKQQQTIEGIIRKRRIQNQKFESSFSEENVEPFFVKNLENVQGDERDTIIFSIGYAKDSRGVMHMNFGPLAKEGGYRRLNVAITRAKYNVKLVGSIYPTDINIDNCKSEGVRLLRSYVEYAKNGKSSLDNELIVNSENSFDSPFEEAIFEFLVHNGYQIKTQVGCSGYRIDMAVKHPTISGRFTLGIECDGASYHSARTARDRDRLRQTQLEDIGWKIYRIWSTDWIKDPSKEGKKLLEAVEDSIQNYSDCDLESKKKENKHEDKFPDFERIIEIQPEQNLKDKICYANLKFANYEKTNPSIITQKLGEGDESYTANVILHIIKKEYPIHVELLDQRITPIFGFQRTTNVIKDYVRLVISKKMEGKIDNRNCFYWPKGEKRVIVRIPKGDDGFRPIKYICTEELAKAMYEISKDSYGIKQRDLIIATARLFGYRRIGSEITESMEAAIQYLLNTRLINIYEEKIIVNPRLIKIKAN